MQSDQAVYLKSPTLIIDSSLNRKCTMLIDQADLINDLEFQGEVAVFFSWSFAIIVL